MTVAIRTWKVLLQYDHENLTVNADVAITGSCEMKESELLMLNHGKDIVFTRFKNPMVQFQSCE